MRLAGVSILVSSLVVLAGSARATDPPDSAVNPQTANIETVTSVLAGSGYEVRHTTDPGTGQPTVTATVTTNSADDRDPRIDISTAGDTWVTWWRHLATDQVRVRKFSLATHTWGADRLVSATSENARNPEIVNDGTSSRIVYEVLGTSSQSIAVGIIADEPDPISTVTLRTTTYTGELDAQIVSQSGHLWITWIDEALFVGWSEFAYTSQEWSTPTYESYAGSDVASARSRIRSNLLNN